MTIFTDLARTSSVDSTRDDIAVQCGEIKRTYRELHDRVLRVASYLVTHLNPGSRIALILDNRVEFVEALYASAAAGMIAVPIDTRLRLKSLEYILNDCRPELIVTQSSEIETLRRCVIHPVSPKIALVDEKAELLGCLSFSELAGQQLGSLSAVSENAPASIMYTTGTTGLRKGVVLTHAALQAAARNINEFTRLPAKTRELVAMPLSHSFALARLRCTFAVGGAVTLVPGIVRQTKQFFAALKNEQTTSLGVVPSACRFLLDHFAREFRSHGDSLAVIEIGSDVLKREYKIQLAQLFPNARICMHYGLTEASRSTFIEFRSEIDHLDTAGRPSPRVEVGILDHNGNHKDAGQEGEICIRAATTMHEYWNKPDETRAAFHRDWLRTGDIGILRPDGYVVLRGRARDVFKISGLSVSSLEVEEVINSFPGVIESGVALVEPKSRRGVLDAVLGAWLVVSEGTAFDRDMFFSHCRSLLEPHKVPSRIFAVVELPRTDSGKLQRRDLVALPDKEI